MLLNLTLEVPKSLRKFAEKCPPYRPEDGAPHLPADDLVLADGDREHLESIIKMWQQRLADHEEAREALRNTGPGESPFSRETKIRWRDNEHALSQALLDHKDSVMRAVAIALGLAHPAPSPEPQESPKLPKLSKLSKLSKNPQENWENGEIQFPRLIDEAVAAGAFTDEVMLTLIESMDLKRSEIQGIIDRAMDKWEAVKAAANQ